MPPFECFDAASKGTIEAFMGSPQYWANREPALEWFGTIPFGMNAEGMTAWFYQGDGLRLWEEALRPLQPGAAPWLCRCPADGRVVPEEDHHARQTSRDSGCASRISAARSSLEAGGTTVLTRAAISTPPSSEVSSTPAECVAPHEDMKLGLHHTAPVLLLPRLARAGNDKRVWLQQEGLRGPTRWICGGRSTMPSAAVQVHSGTDYHTEERNRARAA